MNACARFNHPFGRIHGSLVSPLGIGSKRPPRSGYSGGWFACGDRIDPGGHGLEACWLFGCALKSTQNLEDPQLVKYTDVFKRLFDRRKSYTTVGAPAVLHEPVIVWKRLFFQFLFLISCKRKHFE